MRDSVVAVPTCGLHTASQKLAAPITLSQSLVRSATSASRGDSAVHMQHAARSCSTAQRASRSPPGGVPCICQRRWPLSAAWADASCTANSLGTRRLQALHLVGLHQLADVQTCYDGLISTTSRRIRRVTVRSRRDDVCAQRTSSCQPVVRSGSGQNLTQMRCVRQPCEPSRCTHA